jgi:hypothetical protein
MSKLSKKRKKILDRIQDLEQEIVISLTKKSSNTVEINLPLQRKRIDELKIKLKELK